MDRDGWLLNAACTLLLVLWLASPAGGTETYRPEAGDPVLEPWRWRSLPELQHEGVLTISAEPAGAVWFGLESGMMRDDGLRWTRYGSADGLTDLPVEGHCVGRDGNVYAVTLRGVMRFDGDTWAPLWEPGPGVGWRPGEIREVADGSLWLANGWGALHLSDGRATLYTAPALAPGLADLVPHLTVRVIPDDVATAHPWDPTGLTASSDGVILALEPGGPAEAAGLEVGDRVTGQSSADSGVVQATVLRRGSQTPVDVLLKPGPTNRTYRGFELSSVSEGPDGAVWFGAASAGAVVRHDPSAEARPGQPAWQRYDASDGLDSGEQTRALVSRDGTLWVVCWNALRPVNRFDGKAWTQTRLTDLGGSDKNGTLIQSRDGSIWIGGHGALHAYRDGAWHVYRAPDAPIPSNYITGLLETSDGVLWVAGQGQEAVRLDYATERWKTLRGLLYQCETADGSHWFLSADGGAIRLHGSGEGPGDAGLWTRFGREDGLMDDPVVLLATRTGELWAAGSHDTVAAVARFEPTGASGGRWALETFPGLGWGIQYKAAYEARDGSLWFGMAGFPRPDRGEVGGAIRLGPPGPDGHRTRTHYAPPHAPPQYVYGIGEDDSGRIWFGGPTDLRWLRLGPDGTPLEHGIEETPAGLPFPQVDAIHTARDGALWIGTRTRGAYRFSHGTWQTFDVRAGLAANRVTGILQDLDGSIWVATEKGTSRFDGRTWTRQALPHALGPGLHGALRQTADGALWIVSGEASWYSRRMPGFLVREARHPRLRTIRYLPDRDPPETKITLSIEEVSQPGNTVIAWEGIDRWRSTPDDALQYAWRLNRGDWSPFEQVTTRPFLALRSGHHEFEVKARDRDLNEDPTPAAVTFTVVPPVWRQPWFVALVLALVLGIGLQTARAVRRGRHLAHTQGRLIEEMGKELQIAHDMQMGLLPSEAPRIEGMQLAGACLPANHVGGDYYSYVQFEDDRKLPGVLIADVSGKAMQAATVVMRFNELVRYELRGKASPEGVLKALDRSLAGQIPTGMFVTCGLAALDPQRCAIRYASAGSPEVYHFSASGNVVRPLRVYGFPLGLGLSEQDLRGAGRAYNAEDVTLGAGDLVVFASDGVEEALNETGTFYDAHRLVARIGSAGREGGTAEAVRDAILDDVRRFRGAAPQMDDVTVVVLKAI